ncbi:MAG TPA: hypothetical protein VI318_23790 [Baekduia sp.]
MTAGVVVASEAESLVGGAVGVVAEPVSVGGGVSAGVVPVVVESAGGVVSVPASVGLLAPPPVPPPARWTGLRAAAAGGEDARAAVAEGVRLVALDVVAACRPPGETWWPCSFTERAGAAADSAGVVAVVRAALGLAPPSPPEAALTISTAATARAAPMRKKRALRRITT